MAEFSLGECRRFIGLARQHPELAGSRLRTARDLLAEAERILTHGRDAYLSAALVVGAVSIPSLEAAND